MKKDISSWMIPIAIIVIVGSALSGPVGFLIVNLVNNIPWTNVQTFASSYRYIQTLPYWFGFVYLAGFILFISICRRLLPKEKRFLGDASLVTTAVFASLIGLNYILQVGYVPKAVSNPSEILAIFTMNNPNSICWLLEMFGWGFLGASTWLIASAFNGSTLQKIIKVLLIINGIGSIAIALITPVVPSNLLLQIPGLVAYFLWNIMIWVVMLLIIIDFSKQRSIDSSKIAAKPASR